MQSTMFEHLSRCNNHPGAVGRQRGGQRGTAQLGPPQYKGARKRPRREHSVIAAVILITCSLRV